MNTLSKDNTIILKAEKNITVRFSEVDSMKFVWHGAYATYFEDAREEFGRKYGLQYLFMFENGYYAPLVDLKFSFKRPLTYGDSMRVEIIFRNSEAAKLIFDYTIFSAQNNEIVATGSSVQVFLDRDYHLVWETPKFIIEWKRKVGLIDTNTSNPDTYIASTDKNITTNKTSKDTTKSTADD